MALPLLILGGVAVASVGAFIGAQVDDKLDSPTVIESPIVKNVTIVDFISYGLLAMGGYWVGKKVFKIW